jgi:hypothetical protein
MGTGIHLKEYNKHILKGSDDDALQSELVGFWNLSIEGIYEVRL